MIDVVAADIVIDARRVDASAPAGTWREVPAWFVIRRVDGRDVIDIIVAGNDGEDH